MKKISIIILNYNGRQHLEVCFSSLLKQTYDKFKVIFVDNGSTDDSVKYVTEHFPDVVIIETKKNFGFAEGNNIGIREALNNPDIKYVVTLNNDTEVKADWLEQLVKTTEEDESIGACASKLLYFNERNIIDSAGDYYYKGSLKVHPRGHGKPDRFFKKEECLIACAGAALYRREALEQTKLGNDFFDHDFFAYVEDTDLSLRLRLAGWKCVFVPEAVVYHKVSATTNKLKDYKKKYYSARNRIFSMIKIYPVQLWPKAIKNPITYQFNKVNIFKSLLFYAKLIINVLFKLPIMFRKRSIIKKKLRVNKDIFRTWQSKFSIKE